MTGIDLSTLAPPRRASASFNAAAACDCAGSHLVGDDRDHRGPAGHSRDLGLPRHGGRAVCGGARCGFRFSGGGAQQLLRLGIMSSPWIYRTHRPDPSIKSDLFGSVAHVEASAGLAPSAARNHTSLRSTHTQQPWPKREESTMRSSPTTRSRRRTPPQPPPRPRTPRE